MTADFLFEQYFNSPLSTLSGFNPLSKCVKLVTFTQIDEGKGKND
jgi:hypothetical protein